MKSDSGPPGKSGSPDRGVLAEALPEHAYREIFDTTAEALLVYDEEGRVVLANRRMREMFGFSAEQTASLVVGDLSLDRPPYTRAEARARIERVSREGSSVFEWRSRRSNGDAFWSEVCLHRLVLDGRPCVLACIRDIDERRRMEETLRVSEERFATIFNRSSTMMAFTDPRSGQIVDANEAWLRAMHVRRFEAIGKTGQELGLWVRPADSERLLEELRVGGRVREAAVDLRMGGRTRAAQVSIEWIDLREDRYVLWEVRDVTAEREQAQLRAQLQQAQKMESIGQLAGGIAHDFNNALSIILSFTSIVAQDLHTGDPRREDLEQVIVAAERAAQLTRQLLAFSRKQAIVPRVVDPVEVLRAMQPMLRRIIGEDVELAFRLPPTAWPIKVDVAQLEQAVMNLAVNARDAMPAGGRLTIEAANLEVDASSRACHVELHDGPHVTIAVSDTGTGMDEATRAHAFEPFYTTKGPGKGTGLGLSTVFGIVKQSGGAIRLDTEVGRGTTFTMFFPRTTDSAAGASPLDPVPRPAPREATVLVVEDEPVLRDLVAMVLRRAGYAVIQATHPHQAIELAKAHAGRIDLLVTDVVMPQMNGKQLADALVAARPGLRVLFMSGYADNPVVHHGVVDEDAHFLAKPVTPERLVAMVDRIVSG